MAVLIGSALVTACGSSDDAADPGQGATTTTSAAPTSEALRAAGSPIAEGLVVPAGAKLAGAVFAEPSEGAGHDDWSAYLVVDGDPFAAWDDLAAQLRDGSAQAAIAGSADACTWMWADDAPSPSGGQSGSIDAEPLAERGEPATGGSTSEETSPTTATEVPQEDPYLAAITITDAAPAPEIDGVDCLASAPSSVDGSAQRFTVALRAGTRWPATMLVRSQWGGDAIAGGPTALRSTLERQARQGGGPDIVPGPDSVPAVAADHVPPALDQETPGPGEGFGTEVNCFAFEQGYHQLELPDGAAFVAGGFDEASASVIAVDDADAAIADIQQQTAGDGTSEDGEGTVEPLELADGSSVTDFTFGVSGGGGGCGATTSPDGRFVLVTVHGD